MEPIRLWRWDNRLGVVGATTWHDSVPNNVANEYAALPRAEYDALVAERDQARRQRDGMNEQYEAAMEVIHRNAGARRDGLCGILAWIDEAKEATARAERAEAALRECKGHPPTDDDRRGEDGEAVDAQGGGQNA